MTRRIKRIIEDNTAYVEHRQKVVECFKSKLIATKQRLPHIKGFATLTDDNSAGDYSGHIVDDSSPARALCGNRGREGFKFSQCTLPEHPGWHGCACYH